MNYRWNPSLSVALCLLAGVVTSCPWQFAQADSLIGTFCHGGKVVFGAKEARPRWTMAEGSGVVLVAYSTVSHPKKLNEELVLQIDPAKLRAGKYPVEQVSTIRYYQQGGRILTYSTLSFSGELELKDVTGDRLSGSLSLKTRAPDVDILKRGSISRTVQFQLKLANKAGRCNGKT